MMIVRFRPRHQRRASASRLVATVLITVIGLAGLGAAGWIYRDSLNAAASPRCQIRGNISPTSGERIYHLPGQRYHSEVVVHWWRGERWFCDEADAVRAGWRRSRI